MPSRPRWAVSTAEWEHFFNWLRVDDEKEKIDREAIREKGTSLEGVIEGLLRRRGCSITVENFILYYKDTQKIIAQNHQFIGVNRAYRELPAGGEELAGKLGVFWHTQGSGKSFSMIFMRARFSANKRGNFTFVVVTDRDDLDGQIYRNFLHTGTVSETKRRSPRTARRCANSSGRTSASCSR
jgi:type I restriction enzyme R subunit